MQSPVLAMVIGIVVMMALVIFTIMHPFPSLIRRVLNNRAGSSLVFSLIYYAAAFSRTRKSISQILI